MTDLFSDWSKLTAKCELMWTSPLDSWTSSPSRRPMKTSVLSMTSRDDSLSTASPPKRPDTSSAVSCAPESPRRLALNRSRPKLTFFKAFRQIRCGSEWDLIFVVTIKVDDFKCQQASWRSGFMTRTRIFWNFRILGSPIFGHPRRPHHPLPQPRHQG